MRWLLLLSNSGIIAFYSNGKGDKDLIKINFVKVYTSADTQKTDILKDNIDKSRGGEYIYEKIKITNNFILVVRLTLNVV